MNTERSSLLYVWCFIFLFFAPVIGLEDERQDCESKEKKYQFSVCAIFKNEAKFLKEWIEYHRLIGVEHFYLYNCHSLDFYQKVLNPYIRENIVTLVNWASFFENETEERSYRWAFMTQIMAYEHAIHQIANGTQWLVFLDINEFLVPPQSGKITDILDRYELYPGVTLACDYFDAAVKKNTLPRRKLLIETLELTKVPNINPFKCVAKTIFKPDQTHGFTWPPYACRFKEDMHSIAVGKREMRINHYVNRKEDYFFAKSKNSLHVDNRLLSEDEMGELLGLDFEIEDQDRVIYKFIPELLVRMGYDPTWSW